MKKLLRTILSITLAALILVPLSLPVFADMGAPETKPYDVIVNPGGTVTKDGDFIPEGTVLTINWELLQSDGIWGYTYYNEKGVEVNLADVTNGDVIPEESGTLRDWDSHYEVSEEGGINVYAGPGLAYNVLFHVPNGEKISGNHWVIDWLYVRYGDEGGWICPRNGGVVRYHENPVTLWAVAETPLLKDAFYNLFDQNDENILCLIPADTKLESHYSSATYGYYKVTYEGQSGWIYCHYTDNVVDESTAIFKAADDGAVCLFDLPFDYEEGYFEPSDTLDVKKDEYFVATYILSPRALGNSDGLEWVYIEKDGGAGWTPILLDIYRGDEADYPYASKTLERTDLSYNNYLEIMSEQSADDADTAKTPDTDTEVTDTETKEPEPKDVLPPEPDTNEDETKSDGFFSSPTTIFVFCIVSAVVLALVAAVLLMIIKKKKAK